MFILQPFITVEHGQKINVHPNYDEQNSQVRIIDGKVKTLLRFTNQP